MCASQYMCPQTHSKRQSQRRSIKMLSAQQWKFVVCFRFCFFCSSMLLFGCIFWTIFFTPNFSFHNFEQAKNESQNFCSLNFSVSRNEIETIFATNKTFSEPIFFSSALKFQFYSSLFSRSSEKTRVNRFISFHSNSCIHCINKITISIRLIFIAKAKSEPT